MRYIIHGAGSIGCLVGGLLADSGCDVVLIARPEQAEKINRHGITIHSPFHETRNISNLSVVTSVAAITPRKGDILMLAVKSAHTNHCVHELREIFERETPIFCLQNGVRNEATAAERFLHVYGVMITACVNYLGPGVISHTLHHDLVIGNYPLGCDSIATDVAHDLTNAGFNAILSGHIMAAKWGKLVLNLANALLAITGHHLQLAWVLPEVSQLMAEIQDEGLSVLHAAGIDINEGHSPLDVAGYTARAKMVGSNPPDEEAIGRATALSDLHRTYVSTWIDLEQKRGETEAGYLNGEVILLGQKHNIPTPINELLLDLIDRMAALRLPPGQHTVAEIREMLAQLSKRETGDQ